MLPSTAAVAPALFQRMIDIYKSPLFYTALLYFSLSACVNNSLYRSAEKTGYGYSQETIAADHYRVRFVTRGDNPETAEEHALLRAAELCLKGGYSSFEVLTTSAKVVHNNKLDPSQFLANDDLTNGNLDLPSHGIGESLISLRGTELGLGKTTSKVISEIEIKMFMDDAPKDANTCSANETYATLKQKLVTEKASF